MHSDLGGLAKALRADRSGILVGVSLSVLIGISSPGFGATPDLGAPFGPSGSADLPWQELRINGNSNEAKADINNDANICKAFGLETGHQLRAW
ncbi:MAG: hypothetical protein AAF495_14500 [Pseudomonadota bacterium]